jgi:hypothetical protein
MTFRMRNLLKLNTKRRKAQFFVLSVFTIVGILYLISSWIQPFTIIDTSAAILNEEPFVFNNFKEKAITTVNNSKNCEDLFYNLDEYSNFIQNFASGKNLKLVFYYAIPDCQSISKGTEMPIPFNMTLTSSKFYITSNFTATWTAP